MCLGLMSTERHKSTPEAMHLTAYIEQLDNWMTSNHLKLIAEKSQSLWTENSQQLDNNSNVNTAERSSHPRRKVLMSRNGADICATCEAKRVSANCFYQLRQLWTVRQNTLGRTERRGAIPLPQISDVKLK